MRRVLTPLLLTLLVLAWLCLLAGAGPPALADTVPGTSSHILGIANTAQTPRWRAEINAYIATHHGVDRWRTMFEFWRRFQLDCKRAGKGGGHVWVWSWARAIMVRESGGVWNAYNPAYPYCAGPWQLSFDHRAARHLSLKQSVYPWNQWSMAARLYRDAGTSPWSY